MKKPQLGMRRKDVELFMSIRNTVKILSLEQILALIVYHNQSDKNPC